MFRTHLLRQDTLVQPQNILTFNLLTFLVYNRFRRVTYSLSKCKIESQFKT